MSYQSWHEEHSQKHEKIMKKISNFSIDEIIEYFDYENMKVKEKDFCILYSQNKKCHDISALNCYMCACPNFRVSETKSFCSIDSKDGGSLIHNGFTHQDCSKCIVPHKKEYIKNNFSHSWKEMMNLTFSS